MTDSILVVGEALIDIVEQSDGRRAEHVGGSPANVAVGLSRLGQRARLLTSFGTDAHGAFIARHLESAGVEVVTGSRRAGRTSTALARLDRTGAADYTFDITWDLPTTAAIGSPAAVHTGSIAAFLEPGAAHVLELLESRTAESTISFDPNIRPGLIGPPGTARARVETIVSLSDVVKVSDEDLAWLHPGRDALEIAQTWLELGTSAVFVTLGAAGSFGVSRSGLVDIPARAVEVIDTVGAGDAFMAGLIDGLAREAMLGAGARVLLRAIDAGTLRRVGLHAATVSGLTVARSGAQPPTREEVLAAG